MKSLRYLAIFALFAGIALLYQHALAQTTWSAEYWNNTSLSGMPAYSTTFSAGVSVQFDFMWGPPPQTPSPNPSIQANYFSARYTSTQTFETERYRFWLGQNDGARFYIDGNLIYEHWVADQPFNAEFAVNMTAGQHTLVVEYFKFTGNARFYFDFRKMPIEETEEPMPPTDVVGTPPSVTPTFTPSSTPTPSATQIFQCQHVALRPTLTYGGSDQTVTFVIQNQLPYPVELRRVSLRWQYAIGFFGQFVQSFILNDSPIWAGLDYPPLVDIGNAVNTGAGTATPAEVLPEGSFMEDADLTLNPGNNSFTVRFVDGPNLNASVMPQDFFNDTVFYYDNLNDTTDCALVYEAPVPPTSTPTPSITPTRTPPPTTFPGQWTVNYFNNTDLSGAPVLSELQSSINFNWGAGSPRPGVVNDDNFSARFTSTQDFAGGFYEFVVSSDDGVRIFLDGVLVLDRFVGRPLTTDRFYLDVTPGTHSLIVEYFEGIDQAAIQFFWTQLLTVTELGVQLQGRPEPPHQQWQSAARVIFTPVGSTTPSFDLAITLDFSGKIILKNIPPGAYRVWLKGSHTLAVAQLVTITGGLNAFDLGALPEGDADGDNRVSLPDFSLLASAYGKGSGQSGFDARADFNNDYQVNLFDFSLLAATFGQQGAAP